MAKYVEHRFVNRDKSSGLHGLRDAIQRHDLMALLQCMANGTDLSKPLNQVSSSCTIKSHSTPYVPCVHLTHVLPTSPAGSLRVSTSPRCFSVWEELPPAGGFLDPEWVRTFAYAWLVENCLEHNYIYCCTYWDALFYWMDNSAFTGELWKK